MKTLSMSAPARTRSRAPARCPVELFTPTEDKKMRPTDMLVMLAQSCSALVACGVVHWLVA